MGLFPKLELNLASEFFRWVAIKKKKRFGCGEGSGGASQEGAQGNLCSLHSPPKGLPGRECFGAASPFFFFAPHSAVPPALAESPGAAVLAAGPRLRDLGGSRHHQHPER